MNNRIKISLTFFFFALQCIHLAGEAQGIYQLWGSTGSGGTEDKGVLFTTKSDGTGYQLKKNFTVTNSGKADAFNQPEVYNGKLYCALTDGGLNDDGIIAEYNPNTQSWIKRAELNSIGGKFLVGSLTLYNNKFYGVCNYGGTFDEGLIFVFNPTTFALTKLYDFNSTDGGYPNDGLTLYNSKLYGVTSSGGLYNYGVVYEFNPTNNLYTKKANFNSSTTGFCNSGTKLVAYNSLLWGATNIGEQTNGAAIFSFNPITNALLKKVEINTIGSSTCSNSLSLLNGKLYSTTSVGGTNNSGVIFEYNPATNGLISKYNLSYTTLKHALRFIAYNNLLYGCSASGGANNVGQLASFNPSTNQYVALYNFSNSSGRQGAGALTLYNSKLYGFTESGANYGMGCLFSYDPFASTYAVHIHLGGPEITNPSGTLLYYNHKLYGTCELGGLYQNDHGVGGIFEYDPYTDNYTVKHLFQDTMASPFDQGGFTLLADKFYMVSSYGGATNEGSLCSYDPTTQTVSKLHNFTYASGRYPYGRLSVYNGKLYGMCRDGSSSNRGNIFEYNPVTQVYAERVILDSAKGWYAFSDLTWYNNKFYGCCWSGGAHYGGTIFEYNPAINSYVKKYDMDSSLGNHCVSGLTQLNGKLYGMTMFGGIVDSGALFEYDPVTNGYSKKMDLSDATGFRPYGPLTASNNKIYGMTPAGGNSNCGTLFQFDATLNSFTKKLDFTPNTGKRARSNQLVSVPAPVAPGSANSCINTQTININASNANQWISFTDAQGRAVAEINANGNILGNTAVRLYIHSGSLRQDMNGVYYLDRSITISSSTPPTGNVSLRLYVGQQEFQTIQNTSGSGVNSISDLQLVQNTDFCTSYMTAATTNLSSTSTAWATDYVIQTNVNQFGCFYFKGNPVPITSNLNLRVFIEGFYIAGNTMQPALFNQGVHPDMTVADSITVELHQSVSPFATVASQRVTLSTSGIASSNFTINNGAYYVVVKHRNGVETWSSSPVVMTTNSTYDFSWSQTQALGNNLKEVESGVWAIYSGDINQDASVDALDYILLDADLLNGSFGNLSTDLNGDGTVDSFDYILLDANIISGVSAVTL